MKASLSRVFLTLAVFLCLFAWDQGLRHADRTVPRPTEHRLDADAEERNAEGRREWMREMHWAAPGTDWQAIERDNGIARMQRRNQVLLEAGKRDMSLWTEVGSRNLAGRMHVAAVAATGDSLYGGSSLGGVWKGSLQGEGWRPLSDNLWGGSHGLAIAGMAPEVITTITDDGMVRFSEDGGATWNEPSGIDGVIVQGKRVVRDPSDPDRVYLMLRISGAGMVLYRSDDAGRSYTNVYSVGVAIGDFWLDRLVGGDIYLMAWYTLKVSSDHGATWTDVSTLPDAATRVVMTASEAGAPTFYVAARISNQWRVYRSVDGGVSWAHTYNINDFWETICASSTDPNRVAFAGVELWLSTNGGNSFTRSNYWWQYYDDPVNMLHADFPGLDSLWLGGSEVIYAATDGGLYRSDNLMDSFTNISLLGLGVSQYYSTLTSVNDPHLIAAGAQDQGYQYSSGPDKSDGWDFTQLISGDYGHLTSSDGSHNIVFSVYPGFTLVHTGSNPPLISGQLDFPTGETYSWMPFIVADPNSDRAYYFCATHLYRGYWVGGNNVQYTSVAQDFTEAGGSYLTALGISPVDDQIRIAVNNIGRIWHSQDGGVNWVLSSDHGPSAHYFYGTAIEFSPLDPQRAWIGGSGYSGPAVYVTNDGGVSWEIAGADQPLTLVYDLAAESGESEVLYAATEAGPYRLDPQTDIWEDIGLSEAPLTTYWCVEAVPAAGVMRFGTYGRGIWDYDVDAGPTSVTDDRIPVASRFELGNFPNPFNPQTTINFRLTASARVNMSIYDLTGSRVATLLDATLTEGSHDVSWDGRDGTGRRVASGVYTVRLEAGGQSETHRVVMAK